MHQTANGSWDPAISSDGRYVVFDSSDTSLVSPATTTRQVFVWDSQHGSGNGISLLSTTTLGAEGNDKGFNPEIGGPDVNGDFWVAFVSSATNLVPAGVTVNGKPNVFRRKTTNASTLALISQNNSSGSPATGNGGSYEPAISDDGNLVAFRSSANDVLSAGTGTSSCPAQSTDTNGVDDVFVRNVATSTTTVVSADSAGDSASGASYRPAITPDGRYVAFDSMATNLVAGDTHSAISDVFVRDTLTCVTNLVSLDSSQAQLASGGADPSISSDGRYVGFVCQGASPSPCGGGSAYNGVAVRDLVSNTTAPVSVDPSGGYADKVSALPSLSADGRWVAFASDATTLLGSGGDTNANPDVFLRDRDSGVATAPWAWQGRGAGIYGGGFVNTIAIAPASSTYHGRIAVGGDVAGVELSDDGGNTWRPSNLNGSGYAPGLFNLSVASLAWSTLANGIVYGLTGNESNGALIMSSDGGTTWTAPSTSVVGTANGNHPRPTGQLIAVNDEGNGHLYVGTTTGVDRVDTSGWAVTKIWPPSGTNVQVSGVVMDPQDTSKLFVTVATGATDVGTWQLTGITSSSATPTALPNSGSDAKKPNAVAAVKEGTQTAVYPAGAGVDRCTFASVWSCVGISPPTGSGFAAFGSATGHCNWATINGSYASGTTTLYAGCAYAIDTTVSWHIPVAKIVVTVSGPSYAYTTLPSGDTDPASQFIGGTGGQPWWLIADSARPFPENRSGATTGHLEERLGGYDYVAAQIVVDPATASTLYVVGRSGVWKSVDTGGHWYPAVNGLQLTEDRAVAINPANPAQVADGDVDWSTLVSSAHLGDQGALSEPSNKFSTYAMAYDSANGTLYVGLGQRTSPASGGGVCFTANPWPSPGTTTSWTCKTSQPDGGDEVIGLAVGHPTSTTTRLIAVVADPASGSGVYYSDDKARPGRIARPAFESASRTRTSGSTSGGARDPGAPVQLSSTYMTHTAGCGDQTLPVPAGAASTLATSATRSTPASWPAIRPARIGCTFL